MTETQFHPFANVFPLIDGSDFDELVDDIQRHGLRQPIVLYGGQVLDGRNRLRACEAAGVRTDFTEFSGTEAEALAFVVSANMRRRQLTLEQRAIAAAKIATLGKGRPTENVARATISQTEAAEKFDVSRDSVNRARKVLERGSEALVAAVEAGAVSITRAANVVDRPKRDQLAAATAKPEPDLVEVTPAPDFDFSTYEPDNEDDYQRRIEAVMGADDQLAAMRDQLEQAQREIVGLKASRDHYQHEAHAAVRLVRARDREIHRLRKALTQMLEQNETLRERNAIMESSV